MTPDRCKIPVPPKLAWLLVGVLFLFGCVIGMIPARRAINDPGAISPWLQPMPVVPVPIPPMPGLSPNDDCRGIENHGLNPGCFQRDTNIAKNDQLPLSGGKIISNVWN